MPSSACFFITSCKAIAGRLISTVCLMLFNGSSDDYGANAKMSAPRCVKPIAERFKHWTEHETHAVSHAAWITQHESRSVNDAAWITQREPQRESRKQRVPHFLIPGVLPQKLTLLYAADCSSRREDTRIRKIVTQHSVVTLMSTVFALMYTHRWTRNPLSLSYRKQ